MQPVLSVEQSRAFDRSALAAGVPGLVLMENAARGALEVALELLAERSGRRVVVLTGAGNNGGDGYALARLLATHGMEVFVASAVPFAKLTGDAAAQARAWFAVGGAERASVEEPDLETLEATLESADLIVDALLGTGASRQVEEPLAGWIAAVNRCAATGSRAVLALDVPSGLDADRGRILGVAVRATATVTFAHYKRGLLTPLGREHTGRLERRHIGVPSGRFPWGPEGSDEAPAAWLLEDADLHALRPPRSPSAHKGSSGRVAIVAGSPGKVGAAKLCARGALRGGAGLVTVVTRAEAAAQLEVSALEEMTARIDPGDPGAALQELHPQAIVVGPGLGLDDFAQGVLGAVLARPEPVVLDADALHLLALSERAALGPGPRVLTPHPGEAARLLGSSIDELEGDRFGAAQRLATKYGATVVLKGAYTVIAAPDEVPRVSPWGTALLATGGTGDVLAGLLGACLVHRPPLAAACLAVGLHGASAQKLGGDSVDRGVLASEIADALPYALAAALPRSLRS